MKLAMKPVWLVLLVSSIGTFGFAQTPTEALPPATAMNQLMVDLLYPASSEILLSIYRGGPKDESEWAAVRRSAVALAESGALLMVRGRARDQGEWMKDVAMLVDVGNSAYKAAQARDAKALAAVAGPLDTACITCHKQYRPDVFPRQSSR